jgi:hypothetical protein
MKTRNSILLTALMLSLLSGIARAQDAETPTRAPEVAPTAPTGEPPRAVVTTQQQRDNTRQELDRTRAELDRARAEVEQMRQRITGGRAPNVPPEINIPYLASRSPAGSERPLIVRNSDMKPEVQANLEEDLMVMTRLLQKAMGDLAARPLARRETAMGIDVFVSAAPGPDRSYYLEGYGAVFVLEAGFPMLVPAPARAEARGPSTATAASPWEEARREVYGGPSQGPAAVRETSTGIVDRLKGMLLDVLKNASNIRDLKPEESVTVCVLGGVSGGPAPAWGSVGGGSTAYSMSWSTTGSFAGVNDRNSAPRRTAMTLRIKKSDADAFAKGEITGEEFRNRARITAYSSVERAATAPDRAGQAFVYTVQPGDTLTTILSKVRPKNPSITGEQLMRANPGMRPNRLVAGEKLVIALPQ